MAFDTHTNPATPAPEAVRLAIQSAMSASQTATGKLMAAQGLRTQPRTARDVLDDTLTQIDLQRMAVERAIALIDGEAV